MSEAGILTNIHLHPEGVKLLLHPTIRVYTRKCATNTVEKYERSLVAGMVEICTCKQGVFSQQQCHFLNIQEQTSTTCRSHSGFTHECVIEHVQTL